MDFYKRMSEVCKRIPSGTVATYGQIALLCGRPRNSRQVGYGLRFQLAGDVPAHRVVSAKGTLSGAGYFETWDMQKILLQEEGVEAVRKEEHWAVDLKKYGWKNTIEDALALEKLFETERI